MGLKTIFALASGAGRCGVSIIRISGPKSRIVYEKLTSSSIISQTRLLHNVKLYTRERELIDCAMAVFFAAPKSFTGEDVLELHVHGAPAVISTLYCELSRMEDVRIARQGEFTERAFHSGKMCLREVEGLGDLLEAETTLQRKQALWLFQGGAKEVIDSWRAILIRCLAKLEAFIDFSEDENIEQSVALEVDREVKDLSVQILKELNKRSGEAIRHGCRVVICGHPNAGKSSLFNELVGRNAAIVSPISGTTRDVLQAKIDIRGLPVVLSDTAGIREQSGDTLELEGMRRARNEIQESDLCVHLIDPGNDSDDLLVSHPEVITVYNKCDIYGVHPGVPNISCVTKEGIDNLVELIFQALGKNMSELGQDTPLITRARHRQSLQACVDCLGMFAKESDMVIRAEHLRGAVKHCGRVNGHVDTEEVLDALFNSFCIGK